MHTLTSERPEADALALETLHRLGRIDAGGRAVLSVYVDLDPARFPTPGARAAQVRALLADARRQAEAGGRAEALADVERVGELLEREGVLAGGGLAVFSAAGAGVLEVVRLPEPVEPMAAIDSTPWLEPLAAALTGGDWVVVLVGRSRARVFRGGAHSLVEVAATADVVHRRHAQGGWSQARFQRGIERQVDEHLQRTAELLLRAHERRPFEHLVIGASDELWPELVHRLHRSLRERLRGRIEVDATTDVRGVMGALAPLVERFERDRERELMVRLEAGLGTGGAAAAGLDDVLAMLEQGRVAVLLVAEGAYLEARACPHCGRLTATGETCPFDTQRLDVVDAAERAVDAALWQSATVQVIRHEAAALAERGSIAAVLRY